MPKRRRVPCNASARAELDQIVEKMAARDTAFEMKKVEKELKGYIRSSKFGGRENAKEDTQRVGNAKLSALRNMVTEERVSTAHTAEDKQDIQMVLVNKYINGYMDKLAPSADGAKISLDQAGFVRMATEARDGNFDPYLAYINQVKNNKETPYQAHQRKQYEKQFVDTEWLMKKELSELVDKYKNAKQETNSARSKYR
jgi:hypothetical protein